MDGIGGFCYHLPMQITLLEMPPVDPAITEFVGRFHNDIATLEAKMVEDIQRLKAYDAPRDQISERAALFHYQVEPIRRQIEYIARQVAAVMPSPKWLISPDHPQR